MNSVARCLYLTSIGLFPLKADEEVRDVTERPSICTSTLRSSSARPSPNLLVARRAQIGKGQNGDRLLAW